VQTDHSLQLNGIIGYPFCSVFHSDTKSHLAREKYNAGNGSETLLAPPPKPVPNAPFLARDPPSGKPSAPAKTIFSVDDDSDYRPTDSEDDGVVEISPPTKSSLGFDASLFDEDDEDLGRGNLIRLVPSLFTEQDADVGRCGTKTGVATENATDNDEVGEEELDEELDKEGDPDAIHVDEEEQKRRLAQRQ
jgi:hypothetical protein